MAARGVNKVILIGHLGNDPDVRYSAEGASVTNISLATNDAWQDKQTGQWQERTEWHRVVFFSRLAEVAAEYLRKGSQIYVEGNIRTEEWQDQTGTKRYTTKIYAREMHMLGSRFDSTTAPYAAPGAGAGGAGAGGGYTSPPPPRTPPSPPYGSPSPQGSPPPQYGSPPTQQAVPPSPPPYDGQQYSPPPPTGTVSPPPAGSNNPPSKGFDDDIPF